MAKCRMKKFMRDFRLLLMNKVTKTAELPKTIIVKSIQSTVNCSVFKENKTFKINKMII